MVKCIGPLFSQSAHGKCGAIVYQASKNGQIARTHVLQRYRPTAAQIQQNYFFGVAADGWKELTDEEKAEYDRRATPFRISGFNLFIKENIEHP